MISLIYTQKLHGRKTGIKSSCVDSESVSMLLYKYLSKFEESQFKSKPKSVLKYHSLCTLNLKIVDTCEIVLILASLVCVDEAWFNKKLWILSIILT